MPRALKCEYLSDPLGVQENHPRLSWELYGNDVPETFEVAAYVLDWREVEGPARVDATPREIWRTPAKLSDGSVICGFEPKSRERVYWQLETAEKKTLPWRGVFEFGLLEEGDWKGKWIAGGKSFRREFEIGELPPLGARLYLCGLGVWSGTLNRKKLSDLRMSPAQTDYRKRVLYHVLDVGPMLKAGRNCLEIDLGEGFFAQSKVCGREAWSAAPYGSERLLYQLELNGVNGRSCIVSGEEDMVCSTPFVDDNPYAGEVYDARIECHVLRPAHVCTAPGGKLEADPLPPCRVLRNVKPVRMFFNGDRAIYDMGENFTGVASVTLRGQPRGAEIAIRMAEELTGDGRELDNSTLGIFATKYDQIDRYICAGREREEYAPTFTYHCFRYLELTGWEKGARPEMGDVRGLMIANDIRSDSGFYASEPSLEVFCETAKRTLLDNCLGVPTDCPTREKCGWLGDAQVEAEFGMYAFDMASFWCKYIEDIATGSGDGIPHCIAPGLRRCEEAYPLWGAAIVLLPYYVLLYYGDDRPARRNFALMERWMRYLDSLAEDGIVFRGLGDWCPPGAVRPQKTPVELTSTAIYFHCAEKMAYLAGKLGMEEPRKRFAEKSRFLREKFIARFYRNGSFGSQTADALALEYGLCPAGGAAAVGASLRRRVEENGFHHDCGIVGWKMLFSSLAAAGAVETAWKVLMQKTYPSLNDLVARGATTLWETFETPEQEKRSHCHPMQSGFARFFYRDLGGVRPLEAYPGFERIALRPFFPAELKQVRCMYRTCRGKIGVRWERKGSEIDFELRLPAGVVCEEKVFPEGEKVTFREKRCLNDSDFPDR